MAFFPFTPLDFGVQGGLSPLELEDFDKEDLLMSNVGKGDHSFGLEDQLGEMNTLSSEHGLYHDSKAKNGVVVSYFSKDQNQHLDLDHQQQQQQSKPSFLILDNFNFETVSSPHGFYNANKFWKDDQQQQSKLSSSSLDNFSSFDYSFPAGQVTQPVEQAMAELRNNYGRAFKMLKREGQSSGMIAKGNEIDQNNNYVANVVNGTQKLSTEEVMRIAGARYVQFSSQRYEDIYMPMHHFGYALTGLCEEETEDVEIAHLLLAAAEKVGYKQFERASRLLRHCEWNASFKGTSTVQRVVCYFAEALQERIKKETGLSTFKGNQERSQYVNGLGANLAYISCHQEVPFHPVLQFAAIQNIIETVGNERRIHVIDLEIRFGVQWTGFMKALVEREGFPVELLTITALGVRGKQNIREAGKRLASVAKSLNLPFQFKEVIVSDMQDIKNHLFDEIEDDEAVVVYAPLVLRTMILRPRCLENLMKVMRNINPSLMVVIEVEANHNSPSFVNRFIDALFYHSAFLDCLETCMKQNKYKVILEDMLREAIRNIVAAEGSERVARSVKMDVWRAFFAKLKMIETGFSNSSLYQASLVANKVCCTSSTTLDRNGKGLTVGWKGTPIHSLTAWMFQ
ncbi:DELLA protein RGL1-like isoform X1 [Argentina anserina]|uniref:DELLA protein RGL1-like isoform X1 n=1 Tax=Argentina anserina TaxID=57926 RepID=UPI0021767ED9|nr:DELLA protein RGL1-like isoform X1 [Potentilla anserina]